jgi:hypothetical protein
MSWYTRPAKARLKSAEIRRVLWPNGSETEKRQRRAIYAQRWLDAKGVKLTLEPDDKSG